MMRPVITVVRGAVLSPLWVLQLLTGAKSFTDNPLIGSRWLNARGLHPWRLRAAARLTQMRRRRLATLITPEDRATFDREGYLVKPDFLPGAQFASLVRQARDFRGAAREQVQGDAVTRRLACDGAALAAMPAMAALLSDPRWRGLVRYASSFDTEPLVYVQTLLSHARQGDMDPQERLHSDTFHATAKAWLFLTDVEEDGGCLTYVPGSHRLTPQRLAWERERSMQLASQGDWQSRRGSLRVAPAELAAMGLPPPRQLAVRANTLIVADTHGFHARGISVKPVQRVEIWAYSRRNPFLPFTGLDPWRLPALRDRRINLFWSAADLLERLRLRAQPWKRCPGRSAFDP